jgi:hypothetical protein
MVRSSGPTWMTPNARASFLGTGRPATVTDAPDCTCWLIICRASIRNTWSAPNTTTMSGRSS